MRGFLIIKLAPHTRRIAHSAWQQVSVKSYSTIIKYQKQADLWASTLFAICRTLNHNFLRKIADLLPPGMSPAAPPQQTAEVAALQQQVNTLQLQVATLKEALALIGGR